MKNKAIKNLIILGTIIFSFNLATSVSAYSSDYSSDFHSRNRYIDGASLDYGNLRTSDPAISYSSNRNNTQPTVVNNYYYGTDKNSSNTSSIKSPAEVVLSLVGSKDNSSDTNNSDSLSNKLDSNLLGASAANGLTSLSLRGSGGFMPSSIWQWIFVTILILVIITLIRILAHGSKAKGASMSH